MIPVSLGLEVVSLGTGWNPCPPLAAHASLPAYRVIDHIDTPASLLFNTLTSKIARPHEMHVLL